jgi:hypothetical protein
VSLDFTIRSAFWRNFIRRFGNISSIPKPSMHTIPQTPRRKQTKGALQTFLIRQVSCQDLGKVLGELFVEFRLDSHEVRLLSTVQILLTEGKPPLPPWCSTRLAHSAF